ncbi:carbohydrate kinase family protein [Candidatus Woesearchaeota archaeon]|nr:carbohydrate kinase family protein [Candidatus Woesearchaeota archaeon]
MYDVICVGSSTVDVFAHTKFSELIKIIGPKGETDLLAYPTGSKILIDELNFTTGGGGTNTAVSLTRLGHKVAYLGKLGKDENADFIINSLKKEKINLIVSRKEGYSGYSMILDTLEHDRTILAFKGLNDKLLFNEIPLNKLKTKWFYFSSMMEQSFKTLEKLSDYAKKKNIRVAFNISSYLAEKGQDYLKNILKNTEILILNKEEAELLVGSSGIKNMLRKLAGLGPNIVVITNGKKGVFAFDNKYIYSAKANNIKVIETTGAGDAFASSFLSGIIKKNNIEFAIKLGMTNAESVITYHGAKNNLLTYKEALKIMKKRTIKVKKENLISSE